MSENQDKIEEIENSVIQHGSFNGRIYLMKYGSSDAQKLISKLDGLAEENGYSKIFTKVSSLVSYEFKKNGYVKEAFIPGYFSGGEAADFMSKFLTQKRKEDYPSEKIRKVIKAAKSKRLQKKQKSSENFKIFEITKEHTEDLAALYKKIFATYPFPIFKERYLNKTIDDNIRYFGVKDEGKGTLAAAASAEMDFENSAAEMTDFACLPEYRGSSFAYFLLEKMEEAVREGNGVKTFFTIARAVSFGMNITFSRCGYKYTGTLINNTNISGGLESMNVWYKIIHP